MVSQSDFVITNTSLCMHLAGAFEVPSLTLLGDWYDSAKLHHEQWGYPEGKVLGKEKTSGIIRTIQPIEVLQIVKNSLKLR
jgi:ADP-heptose:LPS heptosyltransferase